MIIDPDAMNLRITAKRVLYSKSLNAGQVRSENIIRVIRLCTTIFSDSTETPPSSRICVAPDYVLIPRSAQDDFVEAIKEAAMELCLDDTLTPNSYANIFFRKSL